MHDLRQLQQSFCKNIFHEANDLAFIKSGYAQERFDVYRQTIFHNMVNALRITYPGVWKLLGAECANCAAHAYFQTKHLPRTGCLDDFGGDFPDFLGSLSELSALPYLRDYAHYEWLRHLAYIAPDAQAISPSDVMNMPEDQIDHVKCHFCPCVYMVQSPYPLFDIHQVVQEDSATAITLKREEAFGVISRQDNDVHTYWIPKDYWCFIKTLSEGQTFSESYRYAQTINNNFNLSAVIAFILREKLIHKIYV
jgi:hypothetical protein